MTATAAPTKLSSNVFDNLKIECVEFWWKPNEIKTEIESGKGCIYDKNNEQHKDAVIELIHSVLSDPRVHEHKLLSEADGYLSLEEGMVRFQGYADFEDGQNFQHFTLHEIY